MNSGTMLGVSRVVMNSFQVTMFWWSPGGPTPGPPGAGACPFRDSEGLGLGPCHRPRSSTHNITIQVTLPGGGRHASPILAKTRTSGPNPGRSPGGPVSESLADGGLGP